MTKSRTDASKVRDVPYDTIDKLSEVLLKFNRDLPRPGLEPLCLSESYKLDETWADEYFPNAIHPGVYVVCDGQNELIYIGKASLNATLGTRLGAHFHKAPDGSPEGPEGWEDAKYIRTIPLEEGHGFEAPAIEEYLLINLKTKANKLGQT